MVKRFFTLIIFFNLTNVSIVHVGGAFCSTDYQ